MTIPIRYEGANQDSARMYQLITHEQSVKAAIYIKQLLQQTFNAHISSIIQNKDVKDLIEANISNFPQHYLNCEKAIQHNNYQGQLMNPTINPIANENILKSKSCQIAGKPDETEKD